MPKHYETWGDLYDAAWGAIREEDLDGADRVVALMLEEAGRSGSLANEASARFTEGALRDAQGELEAAEEAFMAALELDQQVHGVVHPSVADVWRSIGLVQSKMGHDVLDDAAESFRLAERIYEEVEPEQAPNAANNAGEVLLRAGRLDEASQTFARAVSLSEARLHKTHEEALRGLVGHGLVMRRKSELRDSFADFVAVTRRWSDEPACVDLVARAWFEIGMWSNYVLGTALEARVVWGFAERLTSDPALEAMAAAESDKLEVKLVPSLEESFEVFRLTRYDDEAGVGHVAHPSRGLWTFRAPSPAEPGSLVDVRFDESGISVEPRE